MRAPLPQAVPFGGAARLLDLLRNLPWASDRQALLGLLCNWSVQAIPAARSAEVRLRTRGGPASFDVLVCSAASSSQPTADASTRRLARRSFDLTDATTDTTYAFSISLDSPVDRRSQRLLREIASAICLISRILSMRSKADIVQNARLYPREVEEGKALLSEREAEVAEHLREGLHPSEIARKLSLSRRTVERHIYHVYRKLQIGCCWELLQELGPATEPPPDRCLPDSE
ncbi:MAG TPA: LuxR C-terminal-related transcriptional regulator [Spirochaetia bacterium]|nr:LuxR C-terminal-related transcriptional regulator [Spirochaetia bacterium]